MTETDAQEDRDAPKEHGTLRSRRAIGVLACLLVPGGGHLFLGMNKRALAWFGGSAVLLLLTPFSVWPMMLAHFGGRLASAVDVWMCAKANDPAPKLGRAFLSVGGLVFVAILYTTLFRNFVGEAFKIPAASMEPTLRIGDHIMTSKLDRQPARGDIGVFVYPCDPRKDFVKRIVAIEGDTVEVRCDKLYVNGTPAEREAIAEECSYWDRIPGSWQESQCTRYRETLDGHSYEVIHMPARAGEPDEQGEGSFDFPGRFVPSCSESMAGPTSAAAQTLGTLVEHKEPSSKVCSPTRAYQVPEGHFFAMGDNRANSSDSRVWGAIPNSALRAKAVYVWWSRKEPPNGSNWDRFGLKLQ